MSISKPGQVLDLKEGNILGINYKKEIVEAFHGNNKLDKQSINRLYGKSNLLSNFNSRYLFIATHLENMSCKYFNQLLMLENDQKVNLNKTPVQLLKDLNSAIHYYFSDYKSGDYFSTFRKDPSYFVYDFAKQLRELFTFLKKSDKKLFLLTNSLPGYTLQNLQNQFDTNWQSIFDLVVMNGNKPNFFSKENNQNFEKLHNYPNYPNVFKGGNIAQLEKYLNIKNPEEVIYFGDNLIHDIRATKKSCNWNNVAIIGQLINPKSVEKNTKIDPSNYFNMGENLSYSGCLIKKYSDYQLYSILDLYSHINKIN
ncbi:5'-nucleotidase domain-containing [Anaeramoeba flamelloides]|uniref:5'-nucleotidase domain-containing n=1 Tax=Anaeramoeba flamelloides TaxID=1746091 RepID=A0AAV7ZSN8_9EUKA|nr:5'-nucleotidase domain-containing [Anaeramoeba flamelloides]